MIEEIEIKNFKSLYENKIKLSRFCVFIGANGSGKSNLIDALKFSREALTSDVGNAVGGRFGWQQLYSKKPGRKDSISFNYKFDFSKSEPPVITDEELKLNSSQYRISVGNSKNHSYIKNEVLESELFDQKNNQDVSSSFIRTKKEVTMFESSSEEPHKGTHRLRVPELARKSPFLIAPFGSEASPYVDEFIRRWQFFDIDHIAARKPSNHENDVRLLEDGSNLSVILNSITSKKKYENLKSRIENLMSSMIPSFTSWRVERQFDASIGYKIVEKGTEFLPKTVSDGTIRLLSLLVALLHDSRPNQLIAIDEPERCLHPQAVKILVDLMRETSSDKQILITTHSSEIVKWLNAEEVYLVDKIDGRTVIVPGTDVDNIDSFLEEFTMNDLWLDGYLKGGTIH